MPEPTGRRRWILVAVVFAAAVAVTVAAGAVAMSLDGGTKRGSGLPSASASGGGTGLLLRREADTSGLVSQLAGALPAAGIDTVLAHQNRTAVTGPACASRPAGAAAGFCWQDSDAATTTWLPQAITTSADAGPGYRGTPVVMVSWHFNTGGDLCGKHYAKATSRASRISVVDDSDQAKPVYRNVVLGEPVLKDGKPDLAPVTVHSGGMFWYGNYLYVADTDHGFRVFDLSRFLKVTTTGDSTHLGRGADGVFRAYGYLYVLPEVFRYSLPDGAAPYRFSAAALDPTSSPPSVVVPEFTTEKDRAPGRIARFALDPGTHLLAGSGGEARAEAVFPTSVRHMQGAASVHGRYYATASDGRTHGTLYSFTSGSRPEAHPGLLPAYPEDLAYQQAGDLLWTLSECPSARPVFALRASGIG